MKSQPSRIVAFAGRRIDAAGAAPARFSEDQLVRVQRELAEFLDAQSVSAVVGSAACGADILVLEAARARDIAAHIILPFARERFRETSVVDRGAAWGPRFDAAIDYAERNGTVTTIPASGGNDDAAYARATEYIFANAAGLAQPPQQHVVALAVWDQRPRSQADASLQFLELAKSAQLETFEIVTVVP